MDQVSKRSIRSPEKESYWRGHLSGQAAGGNSIRGYCREQGLQESAFYAWRLEIGQRDAQRQHSPIVPPEGQVPVGLAGRNRTRPAGTHPMAVPLARRSAGKAGSTHSGGGLVAVQVVSDDVPRPTASPTLEIVCPGGAVVRLREDVSTEVLCRVMAACQQVHRAQSVCAVRSC